MTIRTVRLSVAAASVAAAILSVTAAAFGSAADQGDDLQTHVTGHATSDGAQVILSTQLPGRRGSVSHMSRVHRAPRSRGPGLTNCASGPLAATERVGGIPEHITAPKPDHPLPGTSDSQFHHCTRSDGSTIQWVSTPAAAMLSGATPPAPPGPSAADLARRALLDLHLPTPVVVTAPPNGPNLFVGFPIWFWIADWTPRSKPRDIPGLSSLATATPVATTLTFDDGTQLRCDGPGTAWQRGVADRQQHSDCTHVFTHHGPHRVTATVTWNQTYTATNGDTGTLGSVNRSTTITLHAIEAQAVLD